MTTWRRNTKIGLNFQSNNCVPLSCTCSHRAIWVFLCLISPAEFCDLALVDTWCFSKSTWSLGQQVTWKSRWDPFTLTHNRIKFNGYWRCETGDAPFCKYNGITWQMSGVDRRLWSIQLKAHLGKIGGHCPSDGGGKVFLYITWSHD